MLSHGHAEVKDSEYVVFVDSSRRYVDCSDAVCNLLGYSRPELFEKRIDDISYDLQAVPKLFAEFVDSGAQEGRFVLQSKHRTPVPIKYKAFVFGDGCKAAIWEPIRDWREPYLSALLETHPDQLKEKLGIVLVAIRRAQAQSSGDLNEEQALRDALSAVNALSKEVK
jgi:PAS domain